jgi:23S rRNA (uracil1939-C5)-methyltransferase
MGKRGKVKFKVFESVRLESAVAEGNCIARVDGQALFVKFGAPGDVVDVQVFQKKKNYMEGRILRFHEKSDIRTNPVCKHFTVCGGCKWQHLPYTEQLKFKQQQVVDSLERIGKVKDFEVLPIVGSTQEYEYRNKLDLSFSDRAWLVEVPLEGESRPKALGFHVPGRFDRVLDIDYCHLMPYKVNEIQRGIRNYCLEHGISFFDPVSQEGQMRNLLVRCNRIGEWMILVSFKENNPTEIEGLMKYIQSSFDSIVSLLYVINGKRNDTLQDLEVVCYSGVPYLTERLGDKTYKIRPQSFFQTNTLQAEVLYSITKEFAGLSGQELVYDLYTGTGSIALFVADQAKEVVGIEYVEEAIIDAKENMVLNQVENCKFYAGDMKDILTADFILEHGKPDVVITDPPRDGMHPSVVARLLEAEPAKIVYVSCNPATQARDAQLLDEKYTLVKIQPVDMFPHTHHVENVGLWELKK